MLYRLFHTKQTIVKNKMRGIGLFFYIFSIIGLRCADTAQKHGRARNMDTLYRQAIYIKDTVPAYAGSIPAVLGLEAGTKGKP